MPNTRFPQRMEDLQRKMPTSIPRNTESQLPAQCKFQTGVCNGPRFIGSCAPCWSGVLSSQHTENPVLSSWNQHPHPRSDGPAAAGKDTLKRAPRQKQIDKTRRTIKGVRVNTSSCYTCRPSHVSGALRFKAASWTRFKNMT